MEQNLDPEIGKGFANQPGDAGKVFQIFRGIISDLSPVVFLVKTRVNLLFRQLELGAHAILLANKDELARRGRIVVAQEIMHPESEVIEIELRKIVAIDRIRIEVVFLQPASKAAPFLVFAPEIADREKESGDNDGSNDVHRQISAQFAE